MRFGVERGATHVRHAGPRRREHHERLFDALLHAGSAAFAQERLPAAALVEDTAAGADARISGSACSVVSWRLPFASRRVGAVRTLRGKRDGTLDQQNIRNSARRCHVNKIRLDRSAARLNRFLCVS